MLPTHRDRVVLLYGFRDMDAEGQVDSAARLAAPAVVFFVSSFVACQFPLHTRMIECKRTALFKLDDLMDRLTPENPMI